MSSEPVDFSKALTCIKSGIPMKRLGWGKKPPNRQKYKLETFTDEWGKHLRTTFLSYVSDHGVLTTEDILADDWVEAE